MKANFMRHALLLVLLSVSSNALRADEASLPDQISTVLKPYVESHSLAGAVTLVAGKDKVLDVSAVGFSDIPAHEAIKTDALFWIASMSKPITATALMILVDEGKVSLDDPIENTFPSSSSFGWLSNRIKNISCSRSPRAW